MKHMGTGPGLSELGVFGKYEAGYRQVRIYRVLRDASKDWHMTFGFGVRPHMCRDQAPKALKYSKLYWKYRLTSRG